MSVGFVGREGNDGGSGMLSFTSILVAHMSYPKLCGGAHAGLARILFVTGREGESVDMI